MIAKDNITAGGTPLNKEFSAQNSAQTFSLGGPSGILDMGAPLDEKSFNSQDARKVRFNKQATAKKSKNLEFDPNLLNAKGEAVYTLNQEDSSAFAQDFFFMLMALLGLDDGDFSYMKGDACAERNALEEHFKGTDAAHIAAKGETSESKKNFVETSKKIENGAISQIKHSTNTENTPLTERQKTVITAVEHAVHGEHRNLLYSLWGAESTFGKERISETGCIGDFQFSQGTFAGTVKNHGTKMVEDMNKGGYEAEANTLQELISSGKVGNNKTKHSDFLALRDNPVISTYAAKYLTLEIAERNNFSPNKREDHANIYMAYMTGDATLQQYQHLSKKYPDIDIKQALLDLTVENSGLKSKTVKAIKSAVQHNLKMFENSTGHDVMDKFADRLESRLKTFEQTISPLS